MLTQDGSHSIYLPELDEHYHSSHGALQEALHVFIAAGFDFAASQFEHIKIMEVGFGTGLNALLSLKAAQANQKRVSYYGLEPFPVPNDLIAKLNYADLIEGASTTEFRAMHDAAWEQVEQLDTYFELYKTQRGILNCELLAKVNLVYFDAFGYRAQEEMWSEAVFKKVYVLMEPGGVLVTYASKGVVRRTLLGLGFLVEKLPGPMGKREMMRAIKS